MEDVRSDARQFYDGDIWKLKEELRNMIGNPLSEERAKQIDGIVNLEKHYKAADVMVKIKGEFGLEDGPDFDMYNEIIKAVSNWYILNTLCTVIM